MIGGTAPHGRPQVTQEGRVLRAGKRGKTSTGGKEKEWTDCLAEEEERRLFGITRRTGAPPHLTLSFGTTQYAKGAVGLLPRE